MKEKTVRKVMLKYFASKNIRVISSRGAGPDLFIDGKAVCEIKGSMGRKRDFDRMLRQLVDYSKKHAGVSLALPFDGLTLKRSLQLINLFDLIEYATDISLKMYIIAPDSSDKHVFYIKELLKGISILWTYMAPNMSRMGFNQDEPDSTIDQAVENLTEYSPEEELRYWVSHERLTGTSRVRI